MKNYNPQEIEKKWQKIWEEHKLYKTPDKSDKPKYYTLVMFPYSSGDLHIGHWYNFAPTDVFARFKRMNGFNVMEPIGFDSFGLPAEGAAIKRGIHPADWTKENIANMEKQLQSMGAIYDWSREIISSEPYYYKWTQWMFLQLYKADLAYKAKVPANWCPSCQTVLANEQVVDGVCWRCSSVVERRELEQWLFRITKYADELLDDVEALDWPEKTKTMQKNWIGRSEGVEINFPVISNKKGDIKEQLTVFTTRPDTIFGVTFMVISPEHPKLSSFVIQENKEAVSNYIEEVKKKSELERVALEKDKTGVFTGSYCENPLSRVKVPIYVADYVLMSYGSGAVMGVPAHDQRDWDFAKKYHLDIVEVIRGGDVANEAYTESGEMANSDQFNGLDSKEAKKRISDYIEKEHLGKRKINYHLRDWLVSRQRYWGAPIPIIYCEKCGLVSVPETDLPVLLPYDVDFTPKGKSPLATNSEFVNTKCPTCGGKATRETDTMDTFVCSSWYYLRYPNPDLEDKPFDTDLISYWLPVDTYVGGAEHTVLHLLYSRFFTKALKDFGYLKFGEPFKTLRHQGIILGPDGQKMSKSKGNIINPDELVKAYGADTVRTYLCFMGPYDQGGPWNPKGIEGIYRFLTRVWILTNKQKDIFSAQELTVEERRFMAKTVKKVTDDLTCFRFNTAVAAIMEWFNFLRGKKTVYGEEIKNLIILISPFAPHLAEEIWQIVFNSAKEFEPKLSVHNQLWPAYIKQHLEEKEVWVVVQVNGKLRDRLLVAVGTSKEDIQKLAEGSPKVSKFLKDKVLCDIVYVSNRLINFVVS
ncbi:MAG: leucine--tRNA ligase [Patescibacteria group bacterium]|nr:leucine--tRNA ligase [Patescibacteria group bacterium]